MIAALALTAVVAGTPPVSPHPAPGTPSLLTNPGREATQAITQTARCGDTFYAAGQFAHLHGGYARNGAFSFSATAPYKVTGWVPSVARNQNAIAVSPDCGTVYIGGPNGIAAVSASTGKRVPGFDGGSQDIDTLQYWNGHLIAGGHFHGAIESLSPRTGRGDGFMGGLHISGHDPNGDVPTKVGNMQVSGRILLAEGSFASVAGKTRHQMFMLNLTPPHGGPAQLTSWYAPLLNGGCVSTESWYVRSAVLSPDRTRVYLATTGDHPKAGNSYPHKGLCDAYASFPSGWHGTNRPHWLRYFGCDSAYSVGVSGGGIGYVYVGGHFQDLNNPRGCNHPGPGAYPDPGFAGLHGSDGSALAVNGHAEYSSYTADWDYMLTTPQGLLIAGTNRYDQDGEVDGADGHSGLALLPPG